MRKSDFADLLRSHDLPADEVKFICSALKRQERETAQKVLSRLRDPGGTITSHVTAFVLFIVVLLRKAHAVGMPPEELFEVAWVNIGDKMPRHDYIRSLTLFIMENCDEKRQQPQQSMYGSKNKES